jgi:hypothetical protein
VIKPRHKPISSLRKPASGISAPNEDVHTTRVNRQDEQQWYPRTTAHNITAGAGATGEKPSSSGYNEPEADAHSYNLPNTVPPMTNSSIVVVRFLTKMSSTMI